MRIVITADDFGFSDDTVDATVDCFTAGAITGASIMANMPATGRAIDYAKAHPEFSYGVHLTLVGDGIERPVTPPDTLPGLVDAQGNFAGGRTVRIGAVLRRLPRAGVEAEIRAQIGRILDAGVPVAYVDSHKHMHKIGLFRSALARVLDEFGITRVRSVQDVYLHRPWTSATFWLGPLWRRQLRRRFRTTERFYMSTTTEDTSWGEDLLQHVAADTLEVGGHPGHDEPWRAQEKADLMAFAPLARARGHDLVGWRDI